MKFCFRLNWNSVSLRRVGMRGEVLVGKTLHTHVEKCNALIRKIAESQEVTVSLLLLVSLFFLAYKIHSCG